MENGKLTFASQEKFNQHLKSLNGPYKLTIKKPVKERSDPQNKYLHGVIFKMIADETGHTAQEVHEAMAWMFLRIPDTKLPTRRSMASLTTVEHEDFASQCRVWASQTLNLFIPLPGEVDF